MENKSNKGFVSPYVLKVRLEAITRNYFSEIKEELANIEKAISVDNDSERDDQLKILIGRYQEIVRLLGEKIQKFIFLIEALANRNAKASVVELYDITLNDYGDIHRKDCARIIAPLVFNICKMREFVREINRISEEKPKMDYEATLETVLLLDLPDVELQKYDYSENAGMFDEGNIPLTKKQQEKNKTFTKKSSDL